MPERPPMELVDTLESLGLATAEQVARMERRVRRLAGDLPRFESVWVDALAQARLLTPFQATELNAGRGRRLRVGDYVLCDRLPYPLYAEGYRARRVETREMSRLVVVESRQSDSVALPKGAVQFSSNENWDSLPLSTPGTDLSRHSSPLVCAEPWKDGRTAAEWMVQDGRFPGEVVLEIARAMAARLAEWERSGVCHGDICASSLLLTDSGEVDLPWPGLRGELRPEEGYAHLDLPPEAFETIAPERISSGTPPTPAADAFSCGCVWWHLLCGRPPLAGGDALSKLRSAEECRIRDVREYAPDAPPPLAAAIASCAWKDPRRRPESMARLSAMLGPPTRDGRERLIAALNRSGRPAVRLTTAARSIRRSKNAPIWLTAAACCAVLLAAIFWQFQNGRPNEQPPKQEIAANNLSVDGSRPLAPKTSQVEAHTTTERADANADGKAIVPTSYEQPEEPAAELVLSGDEPVRAATIRLRDGQRIRAPNGRRVVVLVPPSGMIVERENVCFENIDFRPDPFPSQPDQSQNGLDRSTAKPVLRTAGEAALVRLLAGEAEFIGCRFQYESGLAGGAAIRWIHPRERETAAASLPSGRVAMTDCLLDGVESGIDCRTIGAIALRLTNVLHLGPGPLVLLDHYPWADEPVSLAISQSTLRDAGPLIECFVSDVDRAVGEISILAAACVFAPQGGMPLVRVHSVQPPRRIPNAMQWNGQGSLVAPRVSIFGWFGPDSRQMIVDESELSIAGLVRSEVVFSGPPSNDPSTSRLIRWQAPLQTADPPGIAPERLPRGK